MKKHFIISALGVLALSVAMAFTVTADKAPLQSAGNATYKVVDIDGYTGTNIDWSTVKSNYDIVYMRASIRTKSGNVSKDKLVDTNAKNAHSKGMHIGYYHFFRPCTDKADNIAQANDFYDAIKDLPYDCVPVLDVETTVEKEGVTLSTAQTADAVAQFVDRFQDLTGHKPMIYCSAKNVNKYMDSRVSSCKFWVAAWGYDSVPTDGDSVFSKWDMWQQHNDTTISGVSRQVTRDATYEGKVDIGVATPNVFLNSSSSYQVIDSPNGNYNGDINIGGWAVSYYDIDRVDIYIDGQCYRSIGKDQFKDRPDVDNQWHGSGYSDTLNCGYSLTVPKGYLGYGQHKVDVAIVTCKGGSWSDTRYFNVTSPSDAINLDSPNGTYTGDIGVCGWALTCSEMNRVDIYVDGHYTHSIPASEFYKREDIANAFANSGFENLDKNAFSYTFKRGDIPEGTHSVRVAMLNKFDKATWSSTKTITVNIPEDQVCLDSPSGSYGGSIGVCGWAVTPGQVNRCDVYIDGSFYRSIPESEFYNRGDIAAYFAGSGYSNIDKAGFSCTIDKGALKSGNHTAQVAFLNKNGSVKWSGKKSFSVSIPKDQIWMDGPSGTYTGDIGVYGWTTSCCKPNRIDVYIDGRCCHHIFSDDMYYRADIASYFAGKGYDLDKTGYAYTIPKGELGKGSHVINLAYINEYGGVTWSGEKSFSVNIPNDSIWMDGPSGTYTGDIGVYGWAISSCKPNRIDVYIDGQCCHHIFSDDMYYREDIKNAFAGRGYNLDKSGYGYTIPKGTLTSGSHVINLAYIDEYGGVAWSGERTFSVNIPNDAICMDGPSGSYNGDVGVYGWAITARGLNRIDVYIDGHCYHHIFSEDFYHRDDIASIFAGRGYNLDKTGYSYTIPKGALSQGNHTINLAFINSYGAATWTGSRTFSVNTPNDQISLDGPSGSYKDDVGVYGWALSGSNLKSLEVYVDGKNFTSIKPTNLYYRGDIESIFGGEGYSNIKKSGYSVNLPIENLSNGNHSVAVKLVDENGNTKWSSTKNFSVDVPNGAMCVDGPKDNEKYTSDVGVYGWALSAFGVNHVDIYVNGTLKKTVANDSLTVRNDVKDAVNNPAYTNYDKCGFSATLSHDMFKTGANTVKVVAVDSKGKASSTITRTITVA